MNMILFVLDRALNESPQKCFSFFHITLRFFSRRLWSWEKRDFQTFHIWSLMLEISTHEIFEKKKVFKSKNYISFYELDIRLQHSYHIYFIFWSFTKTFYSTSQCSYRYIVLSSGNWDSKFRHPKILKIFFIIKNSISLYVSNIGLEHSLNLNHMFWSALNLCKDILQMFQRGYNYIILSSGSMVEILSPKKV